MVYDSGTEDDVVRATSFTRQIPGLDGTTVASWTGVPGGTGRVTVDLVNAHGDVVCTANPSDAGSPSGSVQGLDEFGQTLTGAQKTYGWVGGNNKFTDTTTGLVFMGARLYDSLLGLFLQRDPIYGGNDTTYGYPLDPILGYDLTGESAGRQRQPDNGAIPWVLTITWWPVPSRGYVSVTISGCVIICLSTGVDKSRKHWYFAIGWGGVGLGIDVMISETYVESRSKHGASDAQIDQFINGWTHGKSGSLCYFVCLGAGTTNNGRGHGESRGRNVGIGVTSGPSWSYGPWQSKSYRLP